jgi:hypothetical protein
VCSCHIVSSPRRGPILTFLFPSRGLVSPATAVGMTLPHPRDFVVVLVIYCTQRAALRFAICVCLMDLGDWRGFVEGWESTRLSSQVLLCMYVYLSFPRLQRCLSFPRDALTKISESVQRQMYRQYPFSSPFPCSSPDTLDFS